MASKKSKKGRKKKPPSQIDALARKHHKGALSWKNPAEILEQARQYPFLGCWIDADWRDGGLARLAVARQVENNRVLYAVYLVDYYCLGIKDCYWKSDLSLSNFHRRLPEMCGTPEPCETDLAHELIYGAVEYAEHYGFQPHPDFKQARLVLEPPGTYPPRHDIEFGKDGKPFYISGPLDDPERIIATLERTAGEGNYNILMMLGGPDVF